MTQHVTELILVSSSHVLSTNIQLILTEILQPSSISDVLAIVLMKKNEVWVLTFA